jgi:hypothetical protein
MTLCAEIECILDSFDGAEQLSGDQWEGFQSVRRYIFRVGYVRYRLTLITANTCTCFVEVWHGHRVSAPRSFDTAHEFAEFLVSLREDAGIHSSDPEDERFVSMREAAAMSGEDTE